MTLLDAKAYDPKPRQRLIRLIVAAVVIAILSLTSYFLFFRFWWEKHAVDKMFQAIEAKDFEKAYGIFEADPDWKQHPGQYGKYTFDQFKLDWGPSSEFGVITAHHIDCAVEPKASGFQSASGIIVVVRVNNLADRTESLWVEKKSKSISFPPEKAYCGGSTT